MLLLARGLAESEPPCCGLGAAGPAEPEKHELVAGDRETGKGLQVPHGFFETAGIHFRRPATALALEVVVVVARVAADEPHHLIPTQDAFSPALADEALQIPVDRGQTRPAFRHALPDLLYGKRGMGLLQYAENAFALRGLPHTCGSEGGGGRSAGVGHTPRMADSGTMVGMLQHTWGRMGSLEAGAPFLPLSFRLFASFGLVVLHAALPAEGRASGPGEQTYLVVLLLLFVESLWESGRGLKAMDRLFPTPRIGWIRWNLALDLALVTLVIAFQGVVQERFSTLYIFPVLASAFYLGTMEIVGVGVLSAITHVLLVLGFTSGALPPFGLSGEFTDGDSSRISFVLGIASLQVFAATLVVVLIRRNLDSLRTDLSVSEAAVDEISALHQRVVESMNSGLITLDLKGCITSANPAAETILGRSVSIGMPVQDFLPLGDPLLRRRGHENRFEIVLTGPDSGRRILGGHVASLRGPSGRESGQLVLFQDLTDLKALEERTRISERLAAIGQLAAGLAHELRNPLASISGCVQLLQREGSPEEVRARVLGILERETMRVGATVSDFLDFARPTPPNDAILFLPRIMEEIRSSWEMDIRTAGLALTVDPVPPVSFRSDPTGLHRSLTNLLSNARKAVKGSPAPSVRLGCIATDQTLRLSVTDNGCGMTPQQLDRLFVPFAGSFEEGSGLGMSLVYKFIEAMGWRIEVESTPGQGTLVQIFLPTHRKEEAMASRPVQS